jgi:hypothetical protein
MFTCVTENLEATISFQLLTSVLEEPSFSSLVMEDGASVRPHNISSADTISITSSMVWFNYVVVSWFLERLNSVETSVADPGCLFRIPDLRS